GNSLSSHRRTVGWDSGSSGGRLLERGGLGVTTALPFGALRPARQARIEREEAAQGEERVVEWRRQLLRTRSLLLGAAGRVEQAEARRGTRSVSSESTLSERWMRSNVGTRGSISLATTFPRL